MQFSRINIEKELQSLKEKSLTEAQILNQVQFLLEKEDAKDDRIINHLQAKNITIENQFNIDELSLKDIFHINQIEKICVDYRLRFLDSHLFKDEIPYDAVIKIKELEKIHDTKIEGYKIIAPAISFKLKNADDPLLFAPIGNGYYYLIHKWGNDLHPLRKVMMWPFKSFENFICLLLLVSFLLTLLIPNGMFSQNQTTAEFFMIYFFMFKWVAGLALFYGFKKGKNFSGDVWESKYYNA